MLKWAVYFGFLEPDPLPLLEGVPEGWPPPEPFPPPGAGSLLVGSLPKVVRVGELSDVLVGDGAGPVGGA